MGPIPADATGRPLTAGPTADAVGAARDVPESGGNAGEARQARQPPGVLSLHPPTVPAPLPHRRPRRHGRRPLPRRLRDSDPSPHRRTLAVPSGWREIGVDVDAGGGSRRQRPVSLNDVKAHACRAIERADAKRSADRSRAGRARHGRPCPTSPSTTGPTSADLVAVRHTSSARRPSCRSPSSRSWSPSARLCSGCRRSSTASLDTARGEIVYKRYVNFGWPSTPGRGSSCRIPDADRKGLAALSTEIAEVVAVADHRPLPERLEGGTTFTLIVNHPRWHLGRVPVAARSGVHRPAVQAPADASARRPTTTPDRRRRRVALPAVGGRAARAPVAGRAPGAGPAREQGLRPR